MSQNRDDLPYFPYFANNIIADKRYRMMSLEERGLWISMYSDCWPNGAVPAYLESLSKYLGLPIEQVKVGLTERVLSFFKEVKGELFSPQLEEYFHKQTKRRSKLSEGGKKGAKRRWDKDSNGIATPLTNLMATPLATPMASLNTLKSNTLKSNSVFRKEKVKDSFVDEMESTKAIIDKVKVTL